jgi:DNA (cytosine-5)-methyltransferase 1
MSFTFGSLFTGFGGLDLGLERAGMKCKWQAEWNETAGEILLQNFTSIKRYKDVRDINKSKLQWVDLICGGFPCQDVSLANTSGKGVNGGARSGLWSEMFDAVRILRPRYALIENVANLTRKGLERVLCDLASIGFDAQWQTLSAADFGYPHQRKRLFILAYPSGKRRLLSEVFDGKYYPKFSQKKTERFVDANPSTVHIETLGNTYFTIPERIRVDDGLSEGLDEIIKGIGNAVIPEIGEWVGKQIIRFDGEINEQN